jgi:hypothetical protein
VLPLPPLLRSFFTAVQADAFLKRLSSMPECAARVAGMALLATLPAALRDLLAHANAVLTACAQVPRPGVA